MSSETVASWARWGSRFATTTTTSGPCRLLYAMTASLSAWWNRRFRSRRSAGWRRRSRLSAVTSGAMLRPSRSAAAQSRGRNWYFSESRYSSLPSRSGVFSHSSYPAYIPHVGDSVAASTARTSNAGRPPCWR
ncbi:hypothetical protein LUX12_06555 [Streptomyces somaliensis]|uniref:hypothetical protein n=1 Tax=Streptomyces somaliensis TaxID=78355 RepID=UPI0020CF6384|nr:hypothetical protein [Streptomyces somaliensis]MCP9944518.1 hypothetical protein [Streptomyces somaliensis]